MNSIYVLDKLLKNAFLLILPTPAMRPMNNAIKKETQNIVKSWIIVMKIFFSK